MPKRSSATPINSPLKIQLRNALVVAQPQIGKDYLYDRCINKYVDAMLPAISAAIAMNHKSNWMQADEFRFRQAKITKEIGRTGKPQRDIYEMMKEHSVTSLVLVRKTGFSKDGVSELSTVSINPRYKDLVMQELLNLRIEADQKVLEHIEANANYVVSVDPASLSSYIAKTAKTLNAPETQTKGSAYKEALLRNLTSAKQLQSMIHPPDSTHATAYINERWEIGDSGRIYGQGYSLQRMRQEVRHAALGVCHKYDFKACALALMAGLAHEIDPTLKLGALLDYVKNRQKIRAHIASELNIDEGLVKTIFTALGFGAELKNNQHNAIRGVLAKAARMQYDSTVRLERNVYNNLGADEFKRLISHQTLRYIYDELQQVNQTILAYYENEELEINGRQYKAIDPRTGKRRTDKQKLAWIYQALESLAMQQFADCAEQEPLLTTHDCIYFKQKLPARVVVGATEKLQQTFPFLRFEHEPIYPIAGDDYYAALSAEQERFEAEHRQRIEAEKRRAALYIATHWHKTSLGTGFEATH